MNFPSPLVPGKIINRYKRFLSDIVLDENGQQIIAHVANTGRMTSCWEPNQSVLLSYHDDPKRKLKYSLELIHNGVSWIVVNTHLANKLVIEAIQNGQIKELQKPDQLIPEYKVGKSRIDIHLTYQKQETYVEVKSVTLRENEIAYFPDAISTRGQKHLEELIQLKEKGHRAILFLLIQREDVVKFKPAQHIDPTYTELFKQAVDKGVEILVYQSTISPTAIHVNKAIPWEIN